MKVYGLVLGCIMVLTVSRILSVSVLHAFSLLQLLFFNKVVPASLYKQSDIVTKYLIKASGVGYPRHPFNLCDNLPNMDKYLQYLESPIYTSSGFSCSLLGFD